MTFLRSIENAIFEWPRTRFLVLLFAAMFVKTGIWRIPNLDVSAAVARNPFQVPIENPVDQYLMTSWLGPFIAWAIGASEVHKFLLLHLVFAILFTSAMVALLFWRLEEKQARAAMVIFAALPVSATSYFWVSNDSLTLLLMVAALASSRRPLLAGMVGVALGMQHFEQGMFAFSALAVASLLSEPTGAPAVYPWKAAAATALGIAVGKLSLSLMFHLLGLSVSGRMVWLLAHLPDMLGGFWYHAQAIIWSILGLGWFVALRYADGGRSTLPFFLCLFGLLPLAIISGDQTRVLAIITAR
jgi:hypothetical protein